MDSFSFSAYWPLWTGLCIFAFVGTGTPGPNIVLLTAAGSNFGIRRNIPHMLGIASGLAFMLFVVGVAQNTMAQLIPLLTLVLKWLSLLVILLLAWKIATAVAPTGNTTKNRSIRPMSFFQAAAFQWINPKAWVMCVVATSQYVADQMVWLPQMLLIMFTFWLITMVVTPAWTWFGKSIASFLYKPIRRQIFNLTMAALLILSILPVTFGW